MSEERGSVESLRRAEEAVAQFVQAGQFENAGLMLVRIHDHRRAAQFFWKGGHFKKAGDCALRAGYYAQAGEAYSRAGEHLLAAKAFTQAKEMARAAEAYEEAGRFQEASRMYLLVRNFEKAAQVFQRIPDLHPQLREASDLAARAIWEKESGGAAGERRTPSPQDSAPGFEAPPVPAIGGLNHPGTSPPPAAPATSPERPAVAPETSQWTQGVKALQESALLQEFTLADIREIFASGRVEAAMRDTMIIEAGETGQTLYILLEGLVKVTTGKDETEEILAIRLPGEHFGEMSLLEDAPTSANVVAAEESTLFALDRKALEQMIAGTSPLALKLYRAFVKTLIQRLRKATSDLAASGRI